MNPHLTLPTSHLKTFFSLTYWFSAHSLGLLTHPYQSVRRLIRENFYKPLVYLPSVCLLLWWLLGLLVSHFNLLLTAGLSSIDLSLKTITLLPTLLAFLFLWFTLFLLLWQLLLSYLSFRFQSAKPIPT